MDTSKSRTHRATNDPRMSNDTYGVKRLRVLLLEDDDLDAGLVEGELSLYGFDVQLVRARTQSEYEEALGGEFDLVISDFGLPQFDAYRAIATAQERGIDRPIIVVTGQLDDEAAVRCIKLGASDYLLKDRLARLGSAVERALDEYRLRLEHLRSVEHERRQGERLNALRLIDLAITGSLDINVTLNVLLDQVIISLGVDAAAVLLLDANARELTAAHARGFRTDAINETIVRLGECIVGRVAMDRQTQYVPELSESHEFSRSDMARAEGFVSYHCVPLVAKGETQGILELFHRERFVPDREWEEFLEALAAPASIAIDNARLFEEMQRANAALEIAYDRTLQGWAQTLELRDYETKGHSVRVVELSRLIGREVGFDGKMLADLNRGALLHDIGKIAIPDPVLLKPGPLDPDEWEIMKKHPEYAYRLLANIPALREAVEVAYCHHERWDGTGYPLGLKGHQIPILARAFAIADVFDALRSERPYKRAWPKDEARQYILDQRGSHFAPDMVDAFSRIPEDDLE